MATNTRTCNQKYINSSLITAMINIINDVLKYILQDLCTYVSIMLECS